MMEKSNALEKALWSIALPGFGQLLNQKYLKGVTFIVLEILVNVGANFNKVILLSFHGQIHQAIRETNYQFLMFYPCLYFFSIWDAYKDAGGGRRPFSFLPMVSCAFLVTVGLIYSNSLIFGVLFGPVWLPMLFAIPGIILGIVVRNLANHFTDKET